MLYNITYTKVFVDGTLEGIEHNAGIKAASEVTLDRLQARERLNEVITPVVGGSKYRIKDVAAIERIL